MAGKRTACPVEAVSVSVDGPLPGCSQQPSLVEPEMSPDADTCGSSNRSILSLRLAIASGLVEKSSELEIAFRFKTDSLGPRPELNFQTTPLMVDGVLYLTAGTRRAAVALDAATGELLWMHRLPEGKRAELAPRLLSGRGLAYWSDGKEARVIHVTPGYQMIALDAKLVIASPPSAWMASSI